MRWGSDFDPLSDVLNLPIRKAFHRFIPLSLGVQSNDQGDSGFSDTLNPLSSHP